MSPGGTPQDVTRRDALKRGAALGGTLLWTVPAVQSFGMNAALAAPSPEPNGDISFIGMNVVCDSAASTAYTIKYEGCVGDDCFESDPGNLPGCAGFSVAGTPADGDQLGFVVEGPDPRTGCVLVHVPQGCTVTESVVKQGQMCCPGPSGSGVLEFCPPAC